MIPNSLNKKAQNRKFLFSGVVAGAALMLSGAVNAADMYIDIAAINPDNSVYDVDIIVGPTIIRLGDADSTTGIFNEFGFSQFLATSVYDFSDGSLFGDFFDTNDLTVLGALGIPTSGTALDGVSTVDLALPDCGAGQCDLDALSPLVPPINSDSEGFLLTWDLQVVYNFQGILTNDGPVYTGGTFEVYFNSFVNDDDDQLVLSGSLTGSLLQAANLLLFFDVDFALPGFLFVDDGFGNFLDASTTPTSLTLDTNVNPPIPTANQLLLVGTNAIRQTTLDGSITAQLVPAPGTLALLGLGIVGLGASLRRRRHHA